MPIQTVLVNYNSADSSLSNEVQDIAYIDSLQEAVYIHKAVHIHKSVRSGNDVCIGTAVYVESPVVTGMQCSMLLVYVLSTFTVGLVVIIYSIFNDK